MRNVCRDGTLPSGSPQANDCPQGNKMYALTGEGDYPSL